MLAPVIIFAYKRLDSVKRTVESLASCKYADQTELFIFCDGPRNDVDLKATNAVRKYLRSIAGFRNITLSFSEKNNGLAASIIQGVSKIHESYDSVIVLEDDLELAPNFLAYMNAALNFYAEDKRVFSISGYNIPMAVDENYEYDIYFTPRASSWGWASWKDRWQKVDWDVKDFNEFRKDKQKIKAFNNGGSDLFKMLSKRMNGEIDSWAIRWCYSQYKNNLLSVYPVVSKVQNIGFDEAATNSNVYNRYITKLDSGESMDFKFSNNDSLDERFYKQFLDFYGDRKSVV